MSRLQVGGLALITHSVFSENIMKTVKLVSFVGSEYTQGYGNRSDYWHIEPIEELKTGSHANVATKNIFHPAKYLMPLGDKKTQDELAKEKELEYSK